MIDTTVTNNTMTIASQPASQPASQWRAKLCLSPRLYRLSGKSDNF